MTAKERRGRSMTETFVAHDGTRHVCYSTSNGVDRRYLGCAHDKPREAIAHTERKEDTDGLLRPSLALDPGDVPTSRSASHWLTPSFSGVGDYGAEQTEASGLLIAADGPRRPAPTDLVPPGPVGAPSPERVP